MLKKEVNDLLTQTDVGTPMGEMFRQYWIPALLAKELPEDDCPPVRVKLLGHPDGSISDVSILSAEPEGYFEDTVLRTVPGL